MPRRDGAAALVGLVGDVTTLAALATKTDSEIAALLATFVWSLYADAGDPKACIVAEAIERLQGKAK